MKNHVIHRALLLAVLSTVFLMAPGGVVHSEDCHGPILASNCGSPTCRHCSHGCHHKCRRHCRACEPPHGVILPSAPALYFGASTLSVIPAGFHQPPPWPPAQGFGANRQMTDSELLMLLKLLQSQPGQGATPPGNGCDKSAYGATGVSGATIEARLSLVESQVKGLQEAVDEHTTRLADVYAKDPELMKKLQVDPGK